MRLDISKCRHKLEQKNRQIINENDFVSFHVTLQKLTPRSELLY